MTFKGYATPRKRSTDDVNSPSPDLILGSFGILLRFLLQQVLQLIPRLEDVLIKALLRPLLRCGLRQDSLARGRKQIRPLPPREGQLDLGRRHLELHALQRSRQLLGSELAAVDPVRHDRRGLPDLVVVEVVDRVLGTARHAEVVLRHHPDVAVERLHGRTPSLGVLVHELSLRRHHRRHDRLVEDGEIEVGDRERFDLEVVGARRTGLEDAVHPFRDLGADPRRARAAGDDGDFGHFSLPFLFRFGDKIWGGGCFLFCFRTDEISSDALLYVRENDLSTVQGGKQKGTCSPSYIPLRLTLLWSGGHPVQTHQNPPIPRFIISHYQYLHGKAVDLQEISFPMATLIIDGGLIGYIPRRSKCGERRCRGISVALGVEPLYLLLGPSMKLRWSHVPGCNRCYS